MTSFDVVADRRQQIRDCLISIAPHTVSLKYNCSAETLFSDIVDWATENISALEIWSEHFLNDEKCLAEINIPLKGKRGWSWYWDETNFGINISLMQGGLTFYFTNVADAIFFKMRWYGIEYHSW